MKFQILNMVKLAASYVLTLSMILSITWDVPYRQNRTSLAIDWIVGPAAITLATFIVLRKKEKA